MVKPLLNVSNSRGKARKALRAHIFERWAKSYDKCLAPGLFCHEKAIRAHSIQRAGPLTLLADAGHVYVLTSQLVPQRLPLARFQKLGIRRATTFTGLCAKHDVSTFAYADAHGFDSGDRLLHDLLAYRAVLRECHVCMEFGFKLQTSYLKSCDLGLNPVNVATPGGEFATMRLVVAWKTWIYKTKYDDVVLGKRGARLVHRVFELGQTKPRIAVSGLFSLGGSKVARGSDVARAALNVIPTSSGDTFALISCLPLEVDAVRHRLRDVFAARGAELRYQISRLALERCDNIAFAPSFVQSLDDDRREAIESFFNATILGDGAGLGDQRLNLFS